MDDRFSRLPSYLAERARWVHLGGDVPALIAHPDWHTPAPVMLWMHGRTVNKELDPGRYLRWIRAGIAACAVDLPGHGERYDALLHSPAHTLEVVERMLHEVDAVVDALRDPAWKGAFDTTRLGIGGMSAGGMVTLRRLGSPHPFIAASVESTAGDFTFMRDYLSRYGDDLIARLDPIRSVEHWSPIPLLALHSRADEWVPVEAIESLIARLRRHYESLGADADLVQLTTWDSTGAPYEHAGFGRHANDAKNLQTAFLERHLLGRADA